MILVIDNYDSFTYNLVQYFAELGSEPIVFRNDEKSAVEIVAMKPKGIVLSPGPGRPEQAGIMNELISKSTEAHLPILGVCLGHQGIAQVFGARIVHAPTLMHGKTSEILHDSSVLYRDIPCPFTATRYHSLMIDPATLSPEFSVSARTDGDVIMGIQHRTRPIYGVQYHPESIMTAHGKSILGNFLATLR